MIGLQRVETKFNIDKMKVFKILYIICVAGLIMLTFSCNEKIKNIDHEIMVKVPESQLYVRVRGNPEKPLIVNLHGGPGGYSGIDIKLMGPGLEDKFLVAYLDQRGCGKSLECKDIDLLTVQQYVEDLDIVIDFLRKKYEKENLKY